MFTWEDMTNYVGQREQFVGNCGPQNEAWNETLCYSLQIVFYWWPYGSNSAWNKHLCRTKNTNYK
jgi:hypothetical protein